MPGAGGGGTRSPRSQTSFERRSSEEETQAPDDFHVYSMELSDYDMDKEEILDAAREAAEESDYELTDEDLVPMMGTDREAVTVVHYQDDFEDRNEVAIALTADDSEAVEDIGRLAERKLEQ